MDNELKIGQQATNEQVSAKVALFEKREAIIQLANERPTTEDHWDMTPTEYLEMRSLDLKQWLGINYGVISLALERSESWFNQVRSKSEKIRTIELSFEMALKLELVTYGYIKREFSMSREAAALAKRYGAIFNDLPVSEQPYYFQ